MGLRLKSFGAFFCLRFFAAFFAFTLFLTDTSLGAPLLRQGAEGHDVHVLQENLKRLGYEVELTDVFDDATYQAVSAFQRNEGIAASGTVDRETWRSLKARVAEINKPQPSASTPPQGKKPEPKTEKPAAPPIAPEKPSSEPVPEKTSSEKETPFPKAEKVPENTPFLPKGKADAIIKTAKKYIGTRYVFGGTTPKGFDCSGFVQYVFKKNGFTIPRTADEQYKLGKRIKKRGELSPGDLVFFSTYEKGASHCGVYLGKNQFIHVSSSKGVRIDSLDDSYWKPRWYGGKHIVKN